jgi:post-segregation antitoxin (ccd killing protein)
VSSKKNVMIRVDAEIVERAKNIGLNISKVSENALFRAVEAMERAYRENTGDSGTIAYAREDNWCDRRESDPDPLLGKQESYH